MLRTSVLSALAVLATFGFSSAAQADEPVAPDHADPGRVPDQSARWPLVLTGLGVTGFWYGSAVGFSYLWPDAPGAHDLRIPVAGPWLALGETGCAASDPDCSSIIVVLRAVLTTIDGVGQAGGLLAMAEGAFLPTSVFAPRPRKQRPAHIDVAPVPYVAGRDGVGLGLVGSF